VRMTARPDAVLLASALPIAKERLPTGRSFCEAGGEDSPALGEARLRHLTSKCVRALFPSLAAAAALSKKTGERSTGTALHAQ
jgi:hypothetical protein